MMAGRQQQYKANKSRANSSRNICKRPPKRTGASNSMDNDKRMNASNGMVNNRRNTCISMGASNIMDKGKSMDVSKSRAHNRRNTYNSIGTSNSMDKGKPMCASNSMDISNSRVIINNKLLATARRLELLKNLAENSGPHGGNILPAVWEAEFIVVPSSSVLCM
jgi:hypothetical protein